MKLLSALLICAAILLPSKGGTQSVGLLPCNAYTLNVTGTSSNVQLSKCGPSALLQNIGLQEAFYTFGATSALATATTSSYSIPGNSWQLVSVGTNGEWIAAITSTSTTTLRITQGIGQ